MCWAMRFDWSETWACLDSQPKFEIRGAIMGSPSKRLPLADRILTHKRAEDFGDRDASVRVLMVFQNRDQRSAERVSGAVEGVHKMRALFTRLLVADVQPASLIVGAVGCAGDLAPFARITATRHPCFQIKFSIGRASKITRRGIDYSIGHANRIKQIAFDLAKFVMHGIALFRQRERKHLDLRELVDSVKTT